MLLALATFLLIQQGSAGDKTDKTQHVQPSRAAQQAPGARAKTPVVNEKDGGSVEGQKHQEPASNSGDKQIFSPIVNTTAKRDGFDYLGLAINAGLLAVGFFGVRAAYRTLKKISDQAGELTKQNKILTDQMKLLEGSTKAAEDNAQAAKDSALAAKDQFALQVNAERAWVEAKAAPFILVPKTSRRFDWIVTNHGRTVARLIEAQARCIKLATPTSLPGMYDHQPIKLSNIPLAPGNSLPFWAYLESSLSKEFDAADTQDVWNQRFDLVALGYVKYLDAFGQEHETRFCQRFDVSSNEFRLHLLAPADYHRCT